MVYKLKPLELSLDFENRDYELGDTVNLQVSLTPNGDVDVREGRVDLVCEERYIQTGVTFVPDTYAPMARAGTVISGRTKHVAKERKERSVHSSVVFLKDTTLRSDEPGIYSASLRIETTTPRHFDEARDLQREAQSAWTFQWRLVATVNVVRGRNPKRTRTVKVKLPGAPVGQRGGTKPYKATPKKSTGPSS